MVGPRDPSLPARAGPPYLTQGSSRALPAHVDDCPSRAERGDDDVGLDLLHVLRLLRRRWRMAAFIAVLCTLLSVLVISALPRAYRAEALLILDPRRSKISELQAPTDALLSRTQADLSAIRTEAEMILAPTVLRDVVTRLGLADQPAESSAWRIHLGELLARLTGWATSLLPQVEAPDSPAGDMEARDRRVDEAVEALGRRVSVVNQGGSYTLRVQAEDTDPAMAAQIANTVAEVHLGVQQQLQAGERDVELQWLRDRLDGLRRIVRESDAAVESYRTANHLSQGNSASALDNRISEVNSAVTEAKTRLSRESAVLAEAQGSLHRDRGLSAPAVLASPSIQELIVQEAVLESRRGELERGLGPRHPSILDLGGQLAGLRARITSETGHVINGLVLQVTATQGEVADLTAQLRDLEQQRERAAAATVELAELERRADANRQIYTQVLNQFSASLVRQAAVGSNEVRLVAAARPPLQPSGPSRTILAAGGAIASTALGMLTALLLGFWRGGFGGATPLERATGLPTLELVPELSRRELRRLGRAPDASAAAIPIRSLAFMLHAAYRKVGPRSAVLLVTSSLRGEGKSLFASQLARSLATLDARVLLVDLDVWRPNVAAFARLAHATPTGLTIDGVMVQRDPDTGLEMLPVETSSVRTPRPQAFAKRLAAACAPEIGYDLIVLDAPPILPVPDVLAAAARADATLLLVRFEHTRAEAVQAAQLRLASVGVRPLGTVLTRVVPGRHRRYGYAEAAILQRQS